MATLSDDVTQDRTATIVRTQYTNNFNICLFNFMC